MRRITTTAAIVIAALGILAATSCGDSGGDTGELEAELEQLTTQLTGLRSRLDYHEESIQRSQMLSAMLSLQSEDLDGLASDLQTASEIDPEWYLRAERMLEAMQATVWPDEFKERTHPMEHGLYDLLTTLAQGDIATSAQTAATIQESWHALEHELYLYIGGELEHEHDENGNDIAPSAAP